MTVNRRYKRYFIILDNEDMGFAKDDKNLPKGYVKMEVRNGKGTLGVYLQDLKYFENGEYIYRNYLIDTKEEDYVDMGSIMVDKKGKGEHKKKLDPDNVEGTGKKIEDFDIVAIVAEPLNRPEDNNKFCPLVGFINKVKTEWKSILTGQSQNIEEDSNLGIEDIIDENKEAEITEESDNKELKMLEEEKKEIVQPEEAKEESVEEIKEKKTAREENNEKSEELLEKEYQEKYKKIMEAIEKGSKELYKEIMEENSLEEEIFKENEDIEGTEKAAEDNEVLEDIIEENEEAEEIEDYKENQGIEEIQEEEVVDNDEIEELGNIDDNEEIEGMESIEEPLDNVEAEDIEENEDVENTEEALEEAGKESLEENTTNATDNISNNYKELKKNTMNNQEQYQGKSTNYYKKYYDMVHKYIKDMLKYSEEIEPFENNLNNCRWWKMSYSQQNMYRGFLPFFGYILNIYYYNPYIFYMNNCDNLMDKYGHYIFGICNDDNKMPKYYIYGVPGRYLYKEQPFRGMTGFVYWHPIEDKEPRRGDYGYWLLHIDAKTGNVVFPYKPTIPPMY